MQPLQALNEADLVRLTRVAQRLLQNRHLLSSGNQANPLRSGSGIEFLDHKDFSPGDDTRDIDWRTTARSRHPQIRRYSNEASADWFVILDCSASMAIADGAKWQLAVQCAAAISYLLLQLDNQVSVLVFNNTIEKMLPPGRGYSHYARLLQTLGHITPEKSGTASNLYSCVAHIKRNCPVFVISDFLAQDNMQHSLNALSLQSNNVHALQILAEEDFLLPLNAKLQLKDMENGQTLTIDNNHSQQKQYHTAVKHFHSRFSLYCKQRRIHFSRHNDKQQWQNVILDHLQARNK